MELSSPIKSVNKIAADLSAKFKKLGLETIEDLLFYFPYRYDDYSNLIEIEELQPGVLTTIKGQVELLTTRRSWQRKMIITEALISDDSGKIKVVWFSQRYVSKILSEGDDIYLSGKPFATQAGLEFHSPNFEKIGKFEKNNVHTNRLVPIYSSTEKLSQKQIRFILQKILLYTNKIPEWIPPEIIRDEKLLPLSHAINQIHYPSSKENLEAARRRLKFDEIFLMQMRSGLIKKELLKIKTTPIKFKEKETKKFVDNLPFTMTQAQKRSAWEAIQDIGKTKPMNRLLEGDVGSGKTITVALPILNALLNKTQVAYMAPTEILALQHFKSFCEIFADYNFTIALLTRSNAIIFNSSTKTELKKAELIKKIKAQEVDFVIGTHSLIQDKVNFKKLTLIIIDEQHRFGISQRKKLKEKNLSKKIPHFLSMTATPIPRSLALTVYGDLDLSIIDEMPKNRKPIKTSIITLEKRAETYQFIKQEIKKDRQVFIVCPLIDPSDKLGAKAVKEEFEKIDKKIFPNTKIGLLHGRLKSTEKEQIMQDFADNKIKILVSTLVIEVGIDIPNATVMLIESAERFGLAQLHQLRGRVGRAEYQSHCFLFTESDSDNTIKRLQALVTSKNGFDLAEKDLEFRGPGEVYGIKQSGFHDSLKIAKLTDWPIIKMAKPWVEKILQADPELKSFKLIKDKITHFEKNTHFE